MNKNLQNVGLICCVFLSCLNLVAAQNDLSAYTGPVVIIPERIKAAPTFFDRCCTYSDNPLLPSTYLQKNLGVYANIALVATIAIGAGLGTKSGRAIARKAFDGAAQATAAQIASHGSSFAAGALVGSALVHTWYQKIGEPEIIAETRGQDFTRIVSPQADSGA